MLLLKFEFVLIVSSQISKYLETEMLILINIRFITIFLILYFSPFRLIWSVLKVLLPWLLMEKKLQGIYKLESNSQRLQKVIEVQTPKCDIIII